MSTTLERMNLSEAEVQLLAMLYGAESGGEATDRESLRSRGARYGDYLQEWTPAWAALIDRGLIAGNDDGYDLTEEGRSIARTCFSERPDRYYYYYRHFYRRAHESEAHSRLCELAFGSDLTQEGQMDMSELDDLIERLAIEPGQRLLDLGCGAGGIAEYLSDRTGARVTGLDYSAAAVEVGRERTAGKRDRIDFVRGDLNAVELPQQSYDAAIMIDSVYWIADKVDGLQRIMRCIRPGGQLVIVIAHLLESCEKPAELEIDGNFLVRALETLGVEYTAHDRTEFFIPFWKRIRRALDQLHQDFVAEGNEFIYDSLAFEADTEFLPAIEAGEIRRYLYQVRC